MIQSVIDFFVSEKASDTSDGWTSLTSSNSAAQVRVTSEDTAMRSVAVYACVSYISKTIAKLPLKAYIGEPDGEKIEAPYIPAAIMFKGQINQMYEQTRFEFIEQLIIKYLLRGNAYYFMKGTPTQWPAELEPIDDTMVEVKLNKNGRIIYEVRLLNGGRKTYTSDDILHIRGASINGITGLSRISHHRVGMEADRIGQVYAYNSLDKNEIPRGYLSTDQPLGGEKGKETAKEIKKRWHEQMSNPADIAVLGNNLEFKKTYLTPVDLEFIEQRKFSVLDICRIFGVPPHKVAEMSAATFSNIEQQAIESVGDCIQPIVKCIEDKFNLALVDTEAGEFLEFNIDGLLRGDTKSRYEAYAIARSSEWMSSNEIRRKENMPRRIDGGGDDYANPNTTSNTKSALTDKQETSARALAVSASDRIARKEQAILKKAMSAETFVDACKIINEEYQSLAEFCQKITACDGWANYIETRRKRARDLYAEDNRDLDSEYRISSETALTVIWE